MSCSPPRLSTQETTWRGEGGGVELGPVGQIVTLLPVPHSLVTMDKILEAVVTSSYPASVKQGLVRRVLEAARQPLEREQCLALLALGTRLYVSGADELPRRVGCQLLHVAGTTTRRSSPSFSARAACCASSREAPGRRAPARWPRQCFL